MRRDAERSEPSERRFFWGSFLWLGIGDCLLPAAGGYTIYHGGKGWVYYGTVHRHCSHPGLVLPKEGGSQTVGQCGDRHFGSVSAVYEWLLLQLQKGDFLVLLCAFCFSVHIMVIDYFTTKVDGVQMSCIQFFVAALFSGLCMLGIEGIPDPHAVAISWAPILYAGFYPRGGGLHPPDHWTERPQSHCGQFDLELGVCYLCFGRMAVSRAKYVRQRGDGLCVDVWGHRFGPTTRPQENAPRGGVSGQNSPSNYPIRRAVLHIKKRVPFS